MTQTPVQAVGVTKPDKQKSHQNMGVTKSEGKRKPLSGQERELGPGSLSYLPTSAQNLSNTAAFIFVPNVPSAVVKQPNTTDSVRPRRRSTRVEPDNDGRKSRKDSRAHPYPYRSKNSQKDHKSKGSSDTRPHPPHAGSDSPIILQHLSPVPSTPTTTDPGSPGSLLERGNSKSTRKRKRVYAAKKKTLLGQIKRYLGCKGATEEQTIRNGESRILPYSVASKF